MRAGSLFPSLSMLEQTSEKSRPDLLISGCSDVLSEPVLAAEQTKKIPSRAGIRSRRTAASHPLRDSTSDFGCCQQRGTHRRRGDGTAIQRIKWVWVLILLPEGGALQFSLTLLPWPAFLKILRFPAIPQSFAKNTRCEVLPFCYHPASLLGRRHELWPEAPGDPRRLRAPLLGRQHQRDLRAPLLLWRFRLARALPAREIELFHRANRHAHGHLWRHGLVHGYFWRCRRGQARFSPRAFSRV